jgi:hypothetical protein
VTVVRLGDNQSCQHRRIDNTTWECVECHERMIVQHCDTETVLSGGPNAIGCRNPACLAALDDGTYDSENPPAGCTNPSGAYIPTQPREILIGYKYTYDCERCHYDGTFISESGVVFSCGRSHYGDRVPANMP